LAETIRITEIFYSLQGESKSVGLPTVFIRLTGCPLRCHYCDTEYAFQGGSILSIDTIVEQAKSFSTPYITITGGEPLAQKNCFQLLKKLADDDLDVALETSGALDIGQVDDRVIKIMDLKTPGSGEMYRNRYQNIGFLNSNDQVKFVISHREDYLWSKSILEKYQINQRCEILFSPCAETQDPVQLADWILEDQLPVRFQLQLHKILWGNVAGK
jgi:7-carboxy-7-deazaguanine synthase